MGDFRQKAEGLDFRVGAGFDAVADFQHQLVGEDERGIASAGADAVDVGWPRS